MDKTTKKTANKAKTVEVKMDASGRICIPKEIREQLGLKPGVKITVEADVKGDAIILHADPDIIRIVDKNGVPILRGAALDEWRDDEYDEYEVLRDEDGEVRALCDENGKVLDPMKDTTLFFRELTMAQQIKRWGLEDII